MLEREVRSRELRKVNVHVYVHIYFSFELNCLVQVLKHCISIKPLVMYNELYFWNNLRTLSG